MTPDQAKSLVATYSGVPMDILNVFTIEDSPDYYCVSTSETLTHRFIVNKNTQKLIKVFGTL